MSKIALVTGGSRGLGKDMALEIAKKGNDVVVTYHQNKELAENVVDEIKELGQKAVAIQLDVADFKSLDAFVQGFKNILKNDFQTETFDYLVQNAGIGSATFMPDVSEELFDNLLNVHFKTVYFLTQKLTPMMNSGGSIVFISSGSVRFCVPGYSVYAAMKSAVETFSRYVAKEFGAKGIRSNVVAPGAIETDFNNAFFRNNQEYRAMVAKNTALGRTGKPDDIGGVVAFLCSDDSKWVNAQKIEVTGGVML